MTSVKINHTHLITFLLLVGLFFSSFAEARPPILSKRYLKNSPGRVIRTCCAFGSDLKFVGIPFVKRNDIIDKNDLGTHHFMGGQFEKNGIVYTKHGGFIDIGHLRDYADWTAYLYAQIKMNQENLNETTLRLGVEGGKKSLTFLYKGALSESQILEMSGSIAYDLSLWHEIATYFGISLIPVLVPEKFSSFSPEDVYSNLLGTIIGMKAIESDEEYDIAVTAILDEVLDHLGAVDNVKDSYAAMQNVESIWWDSKIPLPAKGFLLKRNLDTENELLPWVVNEDESIKAYSLPKPDGDIRKMYTLNLKLIEKFPLVEILPEQKDREVTQHDFSAFVKYIKKTDEIEEEARRALAAKRLKKGYINILKIFNNDRKGDR